MYKFLRNECDVTSYYYYNGNYGCYTGSFVTSSNRITVRTQESGVAYLNGIWQTSGYIGVYAEVLE